MNEVTIAVFRRAGHLFYRLRLNGRVVEREAPRDARGYVVIRGPDRDACRILDNSLSILLREVEREDPDAEGVRIVGDWT
jgi:hypothetical protein